ncbi:olfactory receptor 1009-like [Bombina bombina]|uniref:olfactory receptor 1009-like n=1 Tax=Bombina bombina TaxID=8345 RepID=UPI00235AD64B|nr:olfactory receptor 1009-like [Bombina bombina]
MSAENYTMVVFFIIEGISDIPEIQTLIFVLVLLMYLIIFGGNMTILLLVCSDSKLHNPMYFFLVNLSIMDVFSATVTLHKTLLIFITGDNSVSPTACMIQLYMFTSLTNNELLILTAMSYDRYVAICNPLRYHMVMNYRLCVLLAFSCWTLGFIEITPILWAISGFNCYTSKMVNHFFCDIVPLMMITCSDTSLLALYLQLDGVVFGGMTPFIFTFISYVFIIITILRIRSREGRRKAFYTCSSHLTVVGLLYSTLGCQYLRPVSVETIDSNKLFSLFNTVAVPMLNPLIYSLKNKDVKSALIRRLRMHLMVT